MAYVAVMESERMEFLKKSNDGRRSVGKFESQAAALGQSTH
jgi:hypothetical protein